MKRSGLQFKALGVFWILLGLVLLGLSPIIFLAGLIQGAEYSVEERGALLGLLPVVLFAVLALITGIALLARRKVARWLTAASSALLLLLAGFLIWGVVALKTVMTAAFLLISLHGLWAAVSSRGQQAFDAYVRRIGRLERTHGDAV